MVGLDDLRGLFQPEWFYDSVIWVRVRSERGHSVFSSDRTATGGKVSSFDDAVFLHTGLATEISAWRQLGSNQAEEYLSWLQHLSWCLFSDHASWIRLRTMYALYLVLSFFHSSGPELVLTTVKPCVVHTGVYLGIGMSEAFLLQFYMEQATVYICTLWQSGNMAQLYGSLESVFHLREKSGLLPINT